MRKIACIFIAILLVVAFAGCGNTKFTGENIDVDGISYIDKGGSLINEKIRQAVSKGKKTITIKDTNFIIEESIVLPSDFHITFKDCILRMGDRTFCNMFHNEHFEDGTGDRNIVIEGQGNVVFDGGKYNGLSESSTRSAATPPQYVQNTILFSNVSGFSVSGIRIVNQRWWGINCYACSDGSFKDIDFLADDQRIDQKTWKLVHGLLRDDYDSTYVKNADGIDLRRSCHDITIENITGFTEDDTIALTLLNGDFEKKFVPSDNKGDIYNISIKNIKAQSYCSLVRLLSQSDAEMYNITVENVEDVSDGVTHFDYGVCALRIGDTHQYGTGAASEDDMHDIKVANLSSSGEYVLKLAGKMRDVNITGLKALNDRTELISEKHTGTNVKVTE